MTDTVEVMANAGWRDQLTDFAEKHGLASEGEAHGSVVTVRAG